MPILKAVRITRMPQLGFFKNASNKQNVFTVRATPEEVSSTFPDDFAKKIIDLARDKCRQLTYTDEKFSLLSITPTGAEIDSLLQKEEKQDQNQIISGVKGCKFNTIRVMSAFDKHNTDTILLFAQTNFRRHCSQELQENTQADLTTRVSQPGK